MRWTSVFTYLSAAALVGGVVSELLHWPTGTGWFLLAWTVLLLPVAIGLLSHPMRAPAWGLFAGFWGVVAVLVLIVLQALDLFGVITGEMFGELAPWPVAVIGIWIIVASGTGFGAAPFPALFDLLGLLTGAGLIAISIGTWTGNTDVIRAAGVAAAVAYVMWAFGVGWVFYGIKRSYRRTRSVAPAL
jgi:hypothetical protein